MTHRRFIGLPLVAAALLALPAPAPAGADDYDFDLVPTELRAGDDQVLELRLTDRRSGDPVDGAVLFATRLDMAPDGMEGMAAPLTPLGSDRPGLYRFGADLAMAGGWRISVAAKLQDEPETVVSRIDFEVQP